MKTKLVLSVLFLLGISVCLSAPHAAAQSAGQIPGQTPAQGILPASFGGWNASGTVAKVPAAQIEQFSSENAAVLREYGITGAERRDFAQGPQTATLTLYTMIDPSAAYGGFTFFRDQQMAPLSLEHPAPYSAGSPNRALIVVGNLLLDIAAPKARPADGDLSQLISLVAPHADARPFPNIADFLPQDGLVHGSEHYLLGPRATAQFFPAAAGQADWIGYDKSAEAVVAHYRLGGQSKDALLLVAIYPTQQIAADRYVSFSKSFALNPPKGDGNGDRPVVFGTRQSALVALVSGVESQELAVGLLKKVHYSSTVTWNEPSYAIKDPSISTIVVGAMTYSGLFMLIALAAGLGFGGFRLFMKKLLPGKIFDRNEDVEILQLGLGSKPIEGKDFYS